MNVLRVEGKQSADAADFFPSERGKEEGGSIKKKRKIDTAARF